jgi:hypothetical protein
MKRRWLSIALLALVLAAAFAFLASNAFYQPTGDPLYDAAARLALRDFACCQPPLYQPLCDRLGISTAWVGSDFEPNAEQLQRYANDPLFLELGLRLKKPGDQRLLLEKRVEERRATPGMFVSLSPHAWYGEDEDKALEMCDAAIATEPDNSFFYYEKAMILISLGEIELASEACRRGNEAPVNRVPWPFPVSRIIEGQTGTGLANRRAAALLLSLYDSKPNWIKFKSGYADLKVAVNVGLEPAALDSFISAARRIGQMENQAPAGLAMATVCAGMLTGARWNSDMDEPDLLLTLNKEQLAERSRINQTLVNLMNAAEELFPQWEHETLNWSLGEQEYGDHQENYRAKTGPPGYVQERLRRTQELGQQLNCLDPPPYAVWQAGKLAH